MSDGRRVLVVDGLAETEQVLKAVLEPRGLHIERVRQNANLPETLAQRRPHLIVLHAGDGSLPPDRDGQWSAVPHIVIGSMQCDPHPADSESGEDAGDRRYFCKPFQYGELIGAIEQMLGS